MLPSENNEPVIQLSYRGDVTRFTFYCSNCFELLCSKAGRSVQLSKPLTKTPQVIYVDPWLIKEYDCFRAFFPSDEISLGLFRLRAGERRKGKTKDA
jgi:hypothetical protein